MKKMAVLLILLTLTTLAFAENEGLVFAKGLELFNKKDYIAAAGEFQKFENDSVYYMSAMHMAGACYNMMYSEVALKKGSSMTKQEIQQGIIDIEKAIVFYKLACAAGYGESCTQALILEQVIITLEPYAQ